MTRLSRFGTLTRRYPNRIIIRNGARVRCRDITGTDKVTEARALKEAVANQVEVSQRQLRERKDERKRRFADEADEVEGDDAAYEEESGVDWLDRAREMNERQRHGVSVGDIEFSEITGKSKVVVEPYPRAFRCECDHLEYFESDTVAGESRRASRTCPDCHSDGQFDLFPYVFVCPRCGHLEQISPTGVHVKHEFEGSQPCPECNEGHVDLVGDENEVGNVAFNPVDCSDPNNHGPWELAGDCPECDFPGTAVGDEEASKLIPGSVDSNLTRVCLLSDLTRGGVGTFSEFKRKADAGAGDPLDWNLEEELSPPSRLLYKELGVVSAFSLSDMESSNVAYGYTPTTSRRRSPIEDTDKFIRTFEPQNDRNSARAFLVKQEGRAVFIRFDPQKLLDAIRGTNSESTVEEIAQREMRVIEEVAPGPFDGTELTLVPTLHSLQHALFESAREMAGLEQFLGSKMFIQQGAIALIERESVGMGGLTQLIIEQDGSVFIEFLRRAKERLRRCDRDCGTACPACNFIDDAHCHPFLSREVEDYVPANALLNRERALKVMDNA